MTRPVLVLLLLGAAFWKAWLAYAARIAAAPSEALPMLLAAAALLAGGAGALRRRGALGEPPLAPLAAGALAYAAAAALAPPMVSVGLAFATMTYAAHHAAASRCPPLAVYGLVALALPVLPTLEFFLAHPLRLLAGGLTAAFLQMNGLGVTAAGAGLLWRGELVQFDAACSGVRMLWAALLLASALGCVRGCGRLAYLAALLIAVAAAVLGNVLRASSLFYLEAGLVEAPGAWAHDAVGAAAFLLTTLLLAAAVNRLQGPAPAGAAR